MARSSGRAKSVEKENEMKAAPPTRRTGDARREPGAGCLSSNETRAFMPHMNRKVILVKLRVYPQRSRERERRRFHACCGYGLLRVLEGVAAHEPSMEHVVARPAPEVALLQQAAHAGNDELADLDAVVGLRVAIPRLLMWTTSNSKVIGFRPSCLPASLPAACARVCSPSCFK